MERGDLLGGFGSRPAIGVGAEWLDGTDGQTCPGGLCALCDGDAPEKPRGANCLEFSDRRTYTGEYTTAKYGGNANGNCGKVQH